MRVRRTKTGTRKHPARRALPGAGRKGFALPAAIFGLVLVGMLVTGGFYIANQESRISHSGERSARAFYQAEEGINHVASNWATSWNDASPWEEWVVEPSDPEDEGKWEVRVTSLGNHMFFLSSEGNVYAGAAHPGARRRVAQIMRIREIDIDVPGALMTRGNVRVAGSARIDGSDTHPNDWDDYCGATADRPGVVVDEDADIQTDGGGEILGDPPEVTDPDMTEEDFTQFGDLSWEELTALADHTFPPGTINNTEPQEDDGTCVTSDPYNWGDPTNPEGACGSHFPIIHVDGDASIQSAGYGQGILLVDGNLSLQGDFTFHGIIIAQGSFETAGGGPRVYGGVMAAAADVESMDYVGSSVVQTSSCAMQRARMNSTAARPIPLADRSWVDLSSAAY